MNLPSHELTWPVAPGKVPLGEREVHLWAASLEVSSKRLMEFSASLSEEEQQRAARFKFDQHRNRYIAGRGILRSILANYLGTDPAALVFAYTSHGKPTLAFEPDHEPLHFNLAHTGNLALLAVTRLGPLGVDVEAVRSVKDVGDLVTRFFSWRENELFQKLDSAEKPAAFFNLWTRKEALLKATGEGIAGGLNRVEVSFLEGEPARVLAIANDSNQASGWTLQEFSPAVGFVGAVAIQKTNVLFRSWRFAD